MATILLLEPKRTLSRQYKRTLEDYGHSVLCYTTAQGAIQAADNTRPDLVIMELTLAGHSGVEFLYEFRSYKEWQSVPIIILSRLRQDDAAITDKSLKDMGVVAYLSKSAAARLALLRRTVDEALTTSPLL